MLSKFSVKKPLTIFVGVILVVLLGVISFMGMSTDLLPKLDLPYVVVMTTYPGAAPERVEQSVTKPLEQTLATTSGIKNVNSVSGENYSVIILEFVQSTNMDTAMLDLSGKIDLIKAQLEEGVGTPTLLKLNPDMLPVMVASVDINNKDINETSKIVQDVVIPEFERIDGVASVEATGLLEESVRVTLDSEKIDALNNKVLQSVDKQLADAKKQIDQGKKQIAEGKSVLEKESAAKTQELVDTSLALEDGKAQLEDAIKDMPKLKEDLETQKKALGAGKDALLWLIDFQEQNGIGVSEEQRALLLQMESGIEEINKGIQAIDNQQPDLKKQLEAIVVGQKQLEVGKLTLNRELTKAAVTLSNQEAELLKAEKEFEAARDEAYEKANLEGVITEDIVSKLIMAQNFSMPAGYITEGKDQYIVKVGDKLSDVEELKNLVLFDIKEGDIGKVALQDIASIEMANNSDEMYAKINGNDGIILTFQKQSTASTSEVSKRINEAMDTLITENPDMHITSLQDQGIYIDIVIDSVLNNLILGGVLAIAILFIFLKSIKPTIIIAFSIPISVLFAVAMMYFSGVTMNIISLSGLALGVGMLVDNSIVVIENIHRLRNEGMNSVKASVRGAMQVSGAIFASTLTTVCVFLPIVFTDGLSRQLFTDMGLTITYSLMASLIVALTLVPSMSSTLLKKDTQKEYKFFDKFITFYEGLLEWSLKHKAIVLGGALILLVGSTYLSIAKGTILIPTMDSNQISVTLEMPVGTDVDTTRAVSSTIIDRITAIEDVETVGAIQSSGGAGFSLMGGGSDRSVSFYVILKEDKKLSSEALGEKIEEATKDIKGDISVNTQTMDMSALGGSGVEVVIKGNDLDKLKEISRDVAALIGEVEGTEDISNGQEDAAKETRITVDKNKATSYGLTVATVYQEIASAIKNETTATSLTVGEDDYSVILVKSEEDTLSREKLKDYKFNVNNNGKEEEVALTDIAAIEEVEGLASINHENQSRFISVTAAVDKNHNVSLVSSEVEKKLQGYEVPKGYSVEMQGELESINTAFSDLIKMITLAIVFIYLIMVAQFQSLLSPFIVMFTIPLAFTGGFIALLISGFELSMIAMLGFLMLAGIVVNNGIVFVDYVNQLRLEGMDKKDALIDAGKTRMRPILMTALTTILGLSTLAMGMGMGADMVQPMAIVTIGGLTYATILTLFVVPVIYDIMHRKELKPIIIDEEDM